MSFFGFVFIQLSVNASSFDALPYLPLNQNNFLITEKILRDLFSPFGTVADVAIKKHTAVPVSYPVL